MKAINLQADAMTRAAQIATRELKQLARDAGTRDRDFRISDLRSAIKRYLAQHPECFEKAMTDVSSWRKNGSRDTAEKKRSINPLA